MSESSCNTPGCSMRPSSSRFSLASGLGSVTIWGCGTAVGVVGCCLSMNQRLLPRILLAIQLQQMRDLLPISISRGQNRPTVQEPDKNCQPQARHWNCYG